MRKALGYVAIATILAAGIIANFHDIRRYVRISTM